MKLFITGFIFGLLATLINRRLLKKAFRESEAVDPLRGYIIFTRLNYLRMFLNILVISAATLKGVPAAIGAFLGIMLQMVFYIFDIIILTRKG